MVMNLNEFIEKQIRRRWFVTPDLSVELSIQDAPEVIVNMGPFFISYDSWDAFVDDLGPVE